MLDEITARNLGLIEHAIVRVEPGLTVITGETGAGKTLMLGALRLLRGEKAGKGYIGPSADLCEVAARFTFDDTETVVRRTVDASRSRAYIDDSASTVSALSDVTSSEVSIVGQHDQLAITSSRGVRALVDRRLSESGLAAVEEYCKTWSEHLDIRGELEAIGSDPRGLERDRDMLAFQIAEIDDASLGPEEEEALRRDLTRLRNAEELGSDANRALTALGDDGLSDHAAQAVEALRSAEAIDPSLTSLTQRVEALATEASDIAGELALYMSDTQADPQHLDELEHRLSLINILKRKYGDTIEDILTFRKGAGVREQALSDLLTAAEDIDERREASLAAVHGAGETLRQHRTIAAEHIASNAVTHLGDLGFSDPVVRIEITGTDPGADGADRATVVFASDVSLAPGPVSSIASGGELSRLVLALTLAAGTAEASVVAFDEIDAGVGGSTALAMGRKLADLARDRQVICVTHLPQVAAYADTHLAVTRSGQTAAIDLLAADERLTELTRMLAGLSDSSTGRDHAEELLAIAAAHS